MHKLTFFPLGNADTLKINLENGHILLFDFFQCNPEENDKRIDLTEYLHKDLTDQDRNYFDVVGFTHADRDHNQGAKDFFFFDHAEKYQCRGRVKIKELWVPAAFIIEEGLTGDAKVIRSEARHRLIEGYGVKVFSRPEKLKGWLKSNGIDIEDRKEFICDAGQLVPNYRKDLDGVEFFIHSPFAKRINDKLEDRNENSLIFHVTFAVKNEETTFWLIGDSNHGVLSDIVQISLSKGRNYRLKWDIYYIPHHCSYLSLNDEKGSEKTEPVEEVEWLLDQGQNRCILVSSSDIIPNVDTDMPPHKQAAQKYKEISSNKNGEFLVTMEYPSEEKPKPIEIQIDSNKATIVRTMALGSAGGLKAKSPRAGKNGR